MSEIPRFSAVNDKGLVEKLPSAAALILLARNQHCDDELKIDDQPMVSRAEGGAWVQSWVWVRYPDAKEKANVDA